MKVVHRAKATQMTSTPSNAIVEAFVFCVEGMAMVQMYLHTMEDVFAREEVAKLKAQVAEANSVVITSHRSPDGDAIGSSLALQHMLKAMGVNASVVMPDAYAKFLHWMPGQEAVRFHDAEPDEGALVAGADVLFCLDYNAPSRAGVGRRSESGLRQRQQHRGDDRPSPRARTFCRRDAFRSTTGSTCELIYRLLQAWDMEEALTPDWLHALYCGLITDTGSFRFASVQPSSHAMAAALLETGMDHSRIHSLVYDACRLEQVQLTAYALSQKLQVFPSIAAPSSV